ncbi:hypothetical protein [Azohydromonas sediminis]|uniref:hypothetical protein n=1 Tax=Azohydromonas sediminis TaxID=2259674 RepID=UPI000E655BD0|nr:hypothetical protein [Azohydromonas sediminis]
MTFSIAPPSPTGLALTPVAQASKAVTAVAPVEPVAAARLQSTDERPTRPVTPLSMSLHLMRVPASRLADVYAEMRSLANDAPGTRFAPAPADDAAALPLHLRA